MVSSPPPAAPNPQQEMAKRLLEQLRQNGGTTFDQMVDQVRSERISRVPGAAPSTPPAAAQDAILRTGTDRERSALAGTNQTLDRMASQGMWYEKRQDELHTEVPSVGKSSGWLASAWGGVKDIVGRPLDKALDSLDLPAEGIERLVGMAYWNELPLGDRWAAGHMTYDSIWSDLFQNGRGGQRELTRDFLAGRSLEEIEAEHGEIWGNSIGHFVLDPLWLIGGVPLVSKTGAFGAVGRGLDFSRIPVLRSVPVVGKMGQPLDEARLAKSLEQIHDLRGAESFTTQRETGLLRRLVHLSPRAKVDEDYTHFTNLLAGIGTDSSVWSRNGQPLRDLFADLYAGNLTRAGVLGLENSTPAKRMRAVMQGNHDFSAAIQSFESLRPISGNAFWSDAPAVLKTIRDGEETSIPDLVRLGRQLTPAEGARYAQYRTAKFLNEFAEKGIPHIWDLHKAPKEARGVLEYVDAFAGGMKSALSLSVLNTPSFVAMNFINNAGAIALKLGDASGAARFARHPWSFSRTERAQLEALGLTEDIAKSMAADTSFWREFVPAAEGSGKASSVLRKASAFVGLASRYDQGMRMRGYLDGARKAAAATWKAGDGGVLRPLTSIEESVPGLPSWVASLANESFDALDSKLLGLKHSDELVNARGFVGSWADEAAQAAGTDPAHAALLRTQLPDTALDEVDDMIQGVREARRAGKADYLVDLEARLDDMGDELNLSVTDMKRVDGFAPDPLPLHNVRADVLAPWQQVAMFSQQQQARRELLGRIVAINTRQLGGVGPTKQLQQQLGGLMEQYEHQVRALLEGSMVSSKSLGPDVTAKSAQDLMQQWGLLLRQRNDAITSALSGLSRRRQVQLTESLRAEVDALAGITDSALSAFDEGADWASHIRRAIAADEEATAAMWTRQGLDWVPQYARSEYPTLGEGFASLADNLHSYYAHIRRALPEALQKSDPLTTDQINAVKNLIDGPDGLRAAMRQRNVVMHINGRATRDFLALNYARKYGFDGPLSVLFPYNFWIGRTVRDWMKLTAARPGQTAALTRFYDATAEINDSADLPDRLKRSIRIPLPPLVSGWMAGPSDMYFDPMRLLYPLASFQDEPIEGQDTTRLGASLEVAQRMPLGMVNPFMTLALGATGALGERDTYVRRSLASARGLPFGIPGPRPLRAAYDWLAGVSEDPDPEVLTEDIKARLAAGEPLPEDWLKSALGGLVDKASSDGFDGYRTDRMVANLVGLDPEKWSPRDGLEALRYRRGPLYAEAQKLAKGERGLAVLSGWLIAPMRVYPEGEQVQRGLDAIYREVRAQDDPKETDKFFKQHPEYQVRRMSQLDRGDGTMDQELDTTLFFLDLGKIEKEIDPLVDELRSRVRRMEEKQYLETKEGRRLRQLAQNDIAQLTERKQAEIDRLEALYPQRSTELSLRASPRERSLFELREKYFSLKRSNFKSDDEFYAARAGFIEDLHQEPVPDGEWLQLAVKAVTVWETASRHAAAQPEQRARIYSLRDQQLRALSDRAGGMVSREDFQAYLSSGQEPPTQNLLEYRKAQTAMTGYLAIAEAPGLTPTQAKAMQRQWWAAHPELEKHYGADEPRAWNAETAQVFGRMDAIWEQFYGVEGDARMQRDFLALHLRELNELRAKVGLLPVKLVDWKQYPKSGKESGKAEVDLLQN